MLRTEATILQSRSLLQAAVDAVFACNAAWKIRFEPSKSQALIIDHHRPAWTVPPICFGDTPVDEESEIKLLGVTFDTHLTVALRANSRLHLLRRAAPILSPRYRETMYKGFVRPLLEYAPLVWMGSSKTSLAQLDRVQRRALHIISEHTWLPSLSLRSLLSHTCTSSTASTCPHCSAALFRRKRPGSPVPTPRDPASSLSGPTNFSCRAIFLSLLAPACIVLFLPGSSPPGILSHRLSWTIVRRSPICRHSRLASSASSGVTTGYGLLTHSNQPAPCVVPHDHILILLFSVRIPTSPTHLSSLHSLPPPLPHTWCVFLALMPRHQVGEAELTPPPHCLVLPSICVLPIAQIAGQLCCCAGMGVV